MPKKYTDGFKQNCVSFLVQLNNGLIPIFNDVEIQDVRHLCLELGISSSTLYRWAETYNDIVLDDYVDLIPNPPKKEEEVSLDTSMLTEREKAMVELGKTKRTPKQDKRIMTVKSEIRLLSLIAGMYDIKNYGTMNLNQLKVKLGTQLIRESGLIETRIKTEVI